MYKQFCDVSASPSHIQVGQKVDFKNVQRRVYDALNVLSAMDIIRKDKYNIIYNIHNEHIPYDSLVSLTRSTLERLRRQHAHRPAQGKRAKNNPKNGNRPRGRARGKAQSCSREAVTPARANQVTGGN